MARRQHYPVTGPSVATWACGYSVNSDDRVGFAFVTPGTAETPAPPTDASAVDAAAPPIDAPRRSRPVRAAASPPVDVPPRVDAGMGFVLPS